MKIVYGNYYGRNIQFVCKRCNCVYEVENKKDWSINFKTCFPYSTDFPEYSVICPNCQYEEILGYDPEDIQGTEYANLYLSCYWLPLLKQREDWNERFRIEPKLHVYKK